MQFNNNLSRRFRSESAENMLRWEVSLLKIRMFIINNLFSIITKYARLRLESSLLKLINHNFESDYVHIFSWELFTCISFFIFIDLRLEQTQPTLYDFLNIHS